MKSGKFSWGVIGAIIFESIAFIDLAVDLYTGQMTVDELWWIRALCVLLSIPFFVFIRNRRRKNK